MTRGPPRPVAGDTTRADKITVWQAEGAVMQLLGIDAEPARLCLRLIARRHGWTLTSTAAKILEQRRLPD